MYINVRRVKCEREKGEGGKVGKGKHEGRETEGEQAGRAEK